MPSHGDYKDRRGQYHAPVQVKYLVALAVTLVFAIAATEDARAAPHRAASEVNCLARIAYKESKGESLKGVLMVMHAAKAHAKQRGVSICKIKAHQATPDSITAKAFQRLAEGVLDNTIPQPTRANTWNNGPSKDRTAIPIAQVGKQRFFFVAKL